MSDDDKVLLTTEQAIDALDVQDGQVHVFMNPSAGVLIGADWSLASITKATESALSRQVGGEACLRMKHGLVLEKGAGDYLFVAANPERLCPAANPTEATQ
jgi:hypothetical protein